MQTVTDNNTGLLVYPGDVGSSLTVRIGVSVIPHYLTLDLISQLMTCEMEAVNIFCDAESSQAHLSREVPAASVKEEVLEFQKELREFGILTRLVLLPKIKDVDLVLTERSSHE